MVDIGSGTGFLTFLASRLGAKEVFAIEHNEHPRLTTESNITTMVQQLRMLGLGYDWEREIRTIDPGYYRWTQWIFLQCYKSWYDPRLRSPPTAVSTA